MSTGRDDNDADESLTAAATLPPLKVKDKTVEEICRLGFKETDGSEKKTKMSAESVKLTAELIRIYALEALTRAADQAKKQDSDEVKQEHLEKVLPQFLLDFS